jgi:hypothetical protein
VSQEINFLAVGATQPEICQSMRIALTPLASGFRFDRPVTQSNDRPPQKPPR